MVKKIDFHIHTISSHKDYQFNYSSDWLKKYVAESKLDAIAITNHDIFDYDNFKSIQDDLKDIEVFPGIELSLEEGHVNIIFSNDKINDLINFSNYLNEVGEDRKRISIEDYCENMHGWEDGIYVFEHGKSNTMKIPEKLSNVTSVAGVSNQLKFQMLYNKENKLTPVLFSDAHATDEDPDYKRNNIDLLKSHNTFLQIDNCDFKEIKRCIDDKSKVNTNEYNLKNIIDISGHSVSTGLNLIIGKRGTGKTKFLKNIKKHFDEEDIYEIAQFETAKADEYIQKQRKYQRQEALEIWKNQYNTQFNSIKDYMKREENEYHGEIDQFLESVKQFAKDHVTSQSSLKYKLITENEFEEISIENSKKYLKKLKDLIDAQDFWSELKDSLEKKQSFIDVYNEFRLIYVEREKNKNLQKITNDIIYSVKNIIQSKTGISNVKKCELSNIIHKYQVEKSIDQFLNTIITPRELKRENIHGYNIIVKNMPFENATQFQESLETKEAVFNDLIKPYLKKNYIKFLHNLNKKKFFKLDNLEECLMHMEVGLLDEDGTPASGGQAVGFALIMRLKEAKYKPIILIDEPEASLDNAYIRNELIHAIKSLSKESMVFVVTHNSTLGALIEPDYLIVTSKNQNKEYQVLTGSFSSNLISDSNGLQEKSFDKFVEAMESGIDNYYRKGEVYENLKS